MSFLLHGCSADVLQAEPVLACKDISLIHELGTEQDHPTSSVLLEEAPHLVPGKRIQPSRWLIQEQNLQNGWNQTLFMPELLHVFWVWCSENLMSWRQETQASFCAKASILGAEVGGLSMCFKTKLARWISNIMTFINVNNYENFKDVWSYARACSQAHDKVLLMLDLNIPYVMVPCLLLYLGVPKHGYSNG